MSPPLLSDSYVYPLIKIEFVHTIQFHSFYIVLRSKKFMKHHHAIIGILISMFILAQVIGLVVMNKYVDIEKSKESGSVMFRDLQIAGTELERPEIEASTSFLYMMFGVLVGTAMLLLIIRWNIAFLWKLWFFMAVLICLSLSFGAFVNSYLAAVLGIVLAYYKIFRPNVVVQNITELFMYGGLAVIFVPIMDLFSGIGLLVLISLYDMYAVWKSKHMVTLAKFQSSQHIFAGMLIPYFLKPHKTPRVPMHMHPQPLLKNQSFSKGMISHAMLGGGDLGFPLLFSGVIMKTYGLWQAYAIIPFAALALYILFLKGEQNRFYPAMPALSLGCFAGLGFVELVSILF